MNKRKGRNVESLNLWSGIFFGVGMVAFIDEAVFHQLLHWHHFYDKATLSIGLISDGLFHAFSWFATVAGLFMLAQLKKHNEWKKQMWMGASFLGTGVFQLYDGTIQHKLMKIHQIRYNVEIIYYDVTWNVLALVLIIIGIVLIKKNSSIIAGEINA